MALIEFLGRLAKHYTWLRYRIELAKSQRAQPYGAGQTSNRLGMWRKERLRRYVVPQGEALRYRSSNPECPESGTRSGNVACLGYSASTCAQKTARFPSASPARLNRPRSTLRRHALPLAPTRCLSRAPAVVKAGTLVSISGYKLTEALC